MPPDTYECKHIDTCKSYDPFDPKCIENSKKFPLFSKPACYVPWQKQKQGFIEKLCEKIGIGLQEAKGIEED
ncbi:MAG: hypothetical protein WCX73_01485 [Candidatus Pacearchaeota archaeon]|jgi:hypothetical protein